jgi:gluconolactonase
MRFMHLRSLSGIAVILVLASCSSLRSPIVPGAVPKDHGPIGAGEGPAWKDGSLYFTDGKHINRLGPDGKTTVFRHNASNGLLFDREGRLVACESGLRRVTRTEKDGSITVLADRFRGKRFNTPNDLSMDSKGRIYFTDPRYGSREGMEIVELRPTDNELSEYYDKGEIVQRKFTPVEGVYRIESPGQVTRILCEGAERPNGILISPDDSFLYIADNNNNTHGGSRKLLRYALDKNGDVKPGTRKVIFDWKDGRGPDGMKMDAAGRIYIAAGTNKATEYETNHFKAGCYILSPAGRLIDFIPTAPDECCNCAFGGKDGKTLFITSGGHLWSVPLK